MKNYLSLIALLPCAIAGLVACTNNSGNTDSTSTTKPDNTEIKTAAVVNKKSHNFLFISDIHLNTAVNNTVYDRNHKDDTGMDIWNAFLKKADMILAGSDSPDFIVYTGDLPAHYDCTHRDCYLPDAERGQHNKNIKTALDSLRSLATRYNKPLFYLPGNNDALAGDYFSFADEKQQTPLSLSPDSKNPYPALNIKAGNTDAPCMVADPHPTMGYYAARPVNGLRLLALNTVILYHGFHIADRKSQSQQQYADTLMNWISNQLADAEANKEKVYIAMHIPPGIDVIRGNSMWGTEQTPAWQNFFLQLNDRFDTTIAAILYGHTHMDELRRLYDSTGSRVTTIAISSPGITPKYSHNPGFKTVRYDPLNKELMDFTTYYTTVPLSNSGWGSSVYTFRQQFNITADVSITEALKNMNIDTLTNYMRNIYYVNKSQSNIDPSIKKGIEVWWGQ